MLVVQKRNFVNVTQFNHVDPMYMFELSHFYKLFLGNVSNMLCNDQQVKVRTKKKPRTTGSKGLVLLGTKHTDHILQNVYENLTSF